jgi:hypothetical protein
LTRFTSSADTAAAFSSVFLSTSLAPEFLENENSPIVLNWFGYEFGVIYVFNNYSPGMIHSG